jgi:hypothetical protein
MKTLFAAVVMAAFAAGAMADSFYQGFATGNPDLNRDRVAESPVVAAQPGVGDSLDRYHGLDEGNGDLFRTPVDAGSQTFTNNPDIYGRFRGPGLTY